jgi:hypothetical protein
MTTRPSDLQRRARVAATPDLVAAYQRDGAVCLRGLLNADEVDRLKHGIDANLACPSPRAIVASQPDDPGFFIEDFCNWQDSDEYRATAFDTALPDAAALLMRSRTVRLYHDHMLTKEPGTRAPTPWHQDQPYYNIDGFQAISFWIPVDPVPREATLEFVAGSHRGPWLMPRTFMDHQAKWFPEGSLAELPDIEGRRADFPVWAGHWSPATWWPSTCWRCTRRPARASVGVCSRCATWATTSRTPRGAGRHRPTSPAWPTNCRPAHRCSTRCSR